MEPELEIDPAFQIDALQTALVNSYLRMVRLEGTVAQLVAENLELKNERKVIEDDREVSET